MKAGVVVEVGKLETWDVADLPEPGEYEALCELIYGATCRGTDLNVIAGRHRIPVAYPTILGHESIGRVVKVGSKVKSFKVGDYIARVGAPIGVQPGMNASWGGFAQYGMAKDHFEMKKAGIPEDQWAKNTVNKVIPPEIDVKQMPMIITWRETRSYLNRIGVKKGTKLLILGGGANALAHAENAHNMGAYICQTIDMARADVFKKAGVDFLIDFRAENLVEELKKACPEGFDILIDGVGYASSVNQVLPLMKPNFTVGVYGWAERFHYALNPFLSEHSVRCYCDGYDEAESHDEVVADMLAGKLDASLYYDLEHPVPLTQIADAYERLRKDEALKFLIDLQK